MVVVQALSNPHLHFYGSTGLRTSRGVQQQVLHRQQCRKLVDRHVLRESRNTVTGVVAEIPGKEWVLAIDVGTGGTKAALVSSLGNVSASAFALHPAPSSVGGVVGSMEQDQESWWAATKTAVWSCLGSSAAVGLGISVAQVACIAVTGQMQDVILLPQLGGRTRSKAILYSDARAESEAAEYAEDLMKDVELAHWIEKLPKLYPTDIPCGEVSASAAEELGCAALQGLPVLHVCGDAGACTLGAGAGAPGSLYAYLGTSGWVAGSFLQKTAGSNVFVPNPPGVFTLAHPQSSLVFKTGSILNAGGNLEWAASNLGPFSGKETRNWKESDRLAASAPAGSEGLLYLPYLNGERCPFEDRNARACFLGISATTSRAHLFRAVMEGVAFAMRSARDAMSSERLSEDISGPLRLVGGGARSQLWPAIMAGVFGQTVEVLEDAQEVGVKGAALLAGKWLEWQSTESPNGSWIQLKSSFIPTRADQAIYQDMYLAYSESYGALEQVFRRLSNSR